MYNHMPPGYDCPFCLVAAGIDRYDVRTVQRDVIYRDQMITAFIAAGWWPKNPGHVLIIPNAHYENIYELPDEYCDRIHRMSKRIALALKEVYRCEGISTRQHNEPAGNQDVWHYHIHVFPRYRDDELYMMNRENTTPEQRAPYAQLLRTYFLQTHH